MITEAEKTAYLARKRPVVEIEASQQAMYLTEGIPEAVAYLLGRPAGDTWQSWRESPASAARRAREYLQRNCRP